jgi:class 3 adenylate cyclase
VTGVPVLSPGTTSGGLANQVMGNGIMALFGAPVTDEDHAVRACYAELDMQVAIRRYADEVRRSAGMSLEIRVGLDSGEVVVRAIGSDLHTDYTAVGQTTHLAARMEQLATGRQELPYRHAGARGGVRRGQAAGPSAGQGPGGAD